MVFVTGATGLLGSHLIYRLVSTGHAVCALKRGSSNTDKVREVFGQYPDGEMLWTRVSWVDGDVLEPDTLTEHIRKATVVYHCAAVVSFSAGDEKLLTETNEKGTRNVCGLCLEYRVRLCYVSSIAALGDAVVETDYIDEETPVIPDRVHSLYSHSKGTSEGIVWQYIGYGLDAVMVCPSVILGAGMWDRSSAKLYCTAARGIPFYTKGVTGYVDVRDVAELMVRLGDDKAVTGQRFVVNGGNYSYRELFTLIALANDRRPPWLPLSPWMTELIWRLLAVVGKISGKKPAFTRETARTSQHASYYSSARILALYPDFHFHELADTVGHIARVAAASERPVQRLKNEK